jgi:NAD(P)-dependent dehydrogenase (short-subunit alcohol dehydrogenase family)
MPQTETVALVTGASRGVGRGVAIALGSHGATVYVTGRTAKAGDHALPGTVYETAEAINAAGGKGIAVQVDHADDAQTKALLERIEREQGHLDILVNNAAAIHETMTDPGPFWSKPVDLVEVMDVGLRSSYVATYHAAPMLLRQGKGLVVFTGSQGGVCYMLGAAYGAHKAGLDKFAADMGWDFKEHGVAVVSIWCGAVLTDRLKAICNSDLEKYGAILEGAETAEFTGHVIWAMANDPEVMQFSGRPVIGAEMAQHYGIKDEGGRQPASMRVPGVIEPYIQAEGSII